MAKPLLRFDLEEARVGARLTTLKVQDDGTGKPISRARFSSWEDAKEAMDAITRVVGELGYEVEKKEQDNGA